MVEYSWASSFVLNSSMLADDEAEEESESEEDESDEEVESDEGSSLSISTASP